MGNKALALMFSVLALLGMFPKPANVFGFLAKDHLTAPANQVLTVFTADSKEVTIEPHKEQVLFFAWW